MSGRARHRKGAAIGAAAVLAITGIAVAAFAFGTTNGNAATEDCGGLDTALRNNLTFIAGQQANPDAQSDARIANRQAVVDQIQQRRAVAGCGGQVAAQDPKAAVVGSGEDCGGLDTALRNNLDFIAGQRANPDAQSEGRIANRQAVVDLIRQRRAAAGCTGDVAAPPAPPAAAQPAATQPAATQPAAEQSANGAVGQVVCAGSTVTLSGEGGAPAASSGEFPVGTTLKVTNLDNGKATTVKVTSASGSCALLNNAAFEQVREPGKVLIRRARIERVG